LATLQTYLSIGALLMGIGVYMVLSKRHTILVLMGIELIFNAANINMIAFGQYNNSMQGQVFTLFVIMIAACEAAVGLAIILNVYRYFRSVEVGKANEMKN